MREINKEFWLNYFENLGIVESEHERLFYLIQDRTNLVFLLDENNLAEYCKKINRNDIHKVRDEIYREIVGIECLLAPYGLV